MKDGRFYVSESSVAAVDVVGDKHFTIAVIGMVHGHVNGMIKGLCEAGATIGYVYDSDSENVNRIIEQYGEAEVLESADRVFCCKEVDLVINCLMPDIRCDFSVKCIEHGIAVFSDKPGFLTLKDGMRIQNAVKNNNGRYCIYFSEHFHHEGSICAMNLIKEGRIGKVFNYVGMGPHRLNESSRPDWFFKPSVNGDVIVDLGCHLVEQFLLYTGNSDAEIICASKGNINHKNHPEFFDCGDFSIHGKNGATGYVKVDWFTCAGIPSWGDCRAFVYGTEGQIEVRKYCDIALSETGDNVYVSDKDSCSVIHAHNSVGFDFFGNFILNCMNREKEPEIFVNGISLSDFCIKAMELTIAASEKAVIIS